MRIFTPAAAGEDKNLIFFSSSSSSLDKWLNCVQVFDQDGHHVRQIGTKGTGPGHFRSPQGIACDPTTGLLYVADSCNDRIQV